MLITLRLAVQPASMRGWMLIFSALTVSRSRPTYARGQATVLRLHNFSMVRSCENH